MTACGNIPCLRYPGLRIACVGRWVRAATPDLLIDVHFSVLVTVILHAFWDLSTTPEKESGILVCCLNDEVSAPTVTRAVGHKVPVRGFPAIAESYCSNPSFAPDHARKRHLCTFNRTVCLVNNRQRTRAC